MADHSKPATASTYTNYTGEIDGRCDDLAVGLDPAVTTATGLITNAIRWTSAGKKWEKFNGTVWADLSTSYSININGTVGATTPSTGAFTSLTATSMSIGGVAVATISGAQTFSGKTYAGGALSGTFSGDTTYSGQITFSNATAPIITAKIGPSSTQQHALPAVTSDTVALVAAAQTLTNKTFNDDTFFLQDETDNTKKAQFQLSGITTGTTQVYTLPNVTGSLAALNIAQTWTSAQTFNAACTFNGNLVFGNANADTVNVGGTRACMLDGAKWQTTTAAAAAFHLAAYDTDGLAYEDMLTLTAGTVPTLTMKRPQVISGDFVMGTAALATTATTGFAWISSCPGVPTGVPTAPYTNAAAMVVDTTNQKLYVRIGSTWAAFRPETATRLDTLWVAAGGITPQFTNGASEGIFETTTNDRMVRTLDFDSVTPEYAQFDVRMPKSWDEGTVTFIPVWSHPVAATNYGVVWSLAAVATSEADALDVAWGTAVNVADTGGATDTVYQPAASGAVTVGGTPVAGDLVTFRIGRLPADASDTLAVDARLHGVVVLYNTNTDTDV